MMAATPVRLHQLPTWLRDRINKRFGRGCDIQAAIAKICEFSGDKSPCAWLDHCGTTKLSNATTAFVSEPYGLTTSAIECCFPAY
jgi:hypothetical protein